MTVLHMCSGGAHVCPPPSRVTDPPSPPMGGLGVLRGVQTTYEGGPGGVPNKTLSRWHERGLLRPLGHATSKRKRNVHIWSSSSMVIAVLAKVQMPMSPAYWLRPCMHAPWHARPTAKPICDVCLRRYPPWVARAWKTTNLPLTR